MAKPSWQQNWQPNQFTGNPDNNPISFAGDANSILDSPAMDVAGGTSKGAFAPTFSQQLMGYKDPNGISFGGYASPLLQTATAGMNAYLGLKQLGLARDTLDFQKQAFSQQFEAQRKGINTELQDRQAARNASGSGYEATDSYMARNAV